MLKTIALICTAIFAVLVIINVIMVKCEQKEKTEENSKFLYFTQKYYTIISVIGLIAGIIAVVILSMYYHHFL